MMGQLRIDESERPLVTLRRFVTYVAKTRYVAMELLATSFSVDPNKPYLPGANPGRKNLIDMVIIGKLMLQLNRPATDLPRSW